MEKRFEGFEIEELKPVDKNDPRGLTFEWKLPNGQQVTVCERKKGCRFGGHYHKGSDPSKNPERLLVVKGKIKARFIIQTEDQENIQIVILEPGQAVTIQPNTIHEMEALDDSIFIEWRPTYFDKKHPDTYPVEV